jgi:voltage-gated potassium channel
MKKVSDKSRSVALVTRPEFNQFKSVIIVTIVLQILMGLFQLSDNPNLASLITSFLIALGIAFLLIFVVDKPKQHHPGFYVISLFLMLTWFVVQLTSFNYFLDALYPESFKGVDTIIDAFYFTIGTISTAGTGDIQPISQAAKLVVSIEIIVSFALVVLVLVKEPIEPRVKTKHR